MRLPDIEGIPPEVPDQLIYCGVQVYDLGPFLEDAVNSLADVLNLTHVVGKHQSVSLFGTLACKFDREIVDKNVFAASANCKLP